MPEPDDAAMNGERRDPTPPAVSLAPHAGGLDEEYVRESLRQIKAAQAAQALVESERTGASKTTSRLLAVFGSTITAAAIGGFVWVWNATASDQRQDAAIEVLETNPPAAHGHVEIERDERELERRVVVVEAGFASINERLDRIEAEETTRHAEVLEELRRIRSGSRSSTWGGHE